MTRPGPWIQDPDLEVPSTFRVRTLRAGAGNVGFSIMAGLTDTLGSLRAWWLVGADPPWPEPSGTWAITFPQMRAIHEQAVSDAPLQQHTEWVPDSGTSGPADAWVHQGHHRVAADGVVQQATPLLGPFTWDTLADPTPPDGVRGIQWEPDTVVTPVSRRAEVWATVTGPAGATGRLAVPAADDWTRQGPTVLHIPGTTGLLEHGPTAVWVEPLIEPADQSGWAHVDLALGVNHVSVDLPLEDPFFDFAALVPQASSWLASTLPATDAAVELTSVKVWTTLRPRRYRWLYPGGGWRRLRQRQSVAGTDSWPLRARQHGAATGSWPTRGRQTGL